MATRIGLPEIPLPKLENKMAIEIDDGKVRTDLILYKVGDRISLHSLNPDEFHRKFEQFSQLLVHRLDRKVLAASRSGDRDEMLTAFRKFDDSIENKELIFWSGPAALTQSAESTFASRERLKSSEARENNGRD